VKVTRVVDGDTVEATVDGQTEDIRYIGVDTPESVKPDTPVQCYALKASHFNEDLVEGKTVRLEYDAEQRDVYGRLLAYVYLGDEFVNAELVKRGYARTLTIPPNTDHAELFARLEREASADERGLWGACSA
jgi:micrococcal nuclease